MKILKAGSETTINTVPDVSVSHLGDQYGNPAVLNGYLAPTVNPSRTLERR